MKVRPAGWSSRYFETAHAIPTRLAIMVQRSEELGRLASKLGHRPRAVGLKYEAGRVRRRSPGREEGSLIDDDDVAPAEIGKKVRGRRAHNPRTDDDDRSPGLHRTSHGSRVCTDHTHSKLRRRVYAAHHKSSVILRPQANFQKIVSSRITRSSG